MTPEERFTKIENLLRSLTEHRVHAEVRHAAEVRVRRIEIGFTEMQSAMTRLSDSMTRMSGDVRLLASASGDLIRVSRGLVESTGVMRDMLVLRSKRLDRLEGQA